MYHTCFLQYYSFAIAWLLKSTKYIPVLQVTSAQPKHHQVQNYESVTGILFNQNIVAFCIDIVFLIIMTNISRIG